MIRAHRRRPRGRGEAVAAGLPDRVQAARVRRRLLRGVQPRQRDARRPARGRDRRDHADRDPHRAGPLRARRHHLRHRLRRHDRRAQPDRHPRPRRPAAPRRVGGRRPHAASGCSRSGSPTCSRSPARAARRCSPTWSSASSSTWSGSATASPTSATTATDSIEPTLEAQDEWVEHVNDGREGHDVRRAHLQLVVPGRQHPRQAPGVHALRRRAAEPTSRVPTRSRPAGYEGFALA